MNNNILKSASIVLKVVQIGVLAAGIGCTGYFMGEYIEFANKASDSAGSDAYNAGQYGRLEFFLYACGVGIIIAICGAVASGTGFQTSRPFSMVTLYVPATLQLLVSTALLARVLAEYEKKNGGTSMCKNMDVADTKFQCGQIIGGLVCGFLGTALFAADSLISFVLYRRS